jgi:ATP-dependent Clp protease ATP-binding subunit ClpX
MEIDLFSKNAYVPRQQTIKRTLDQYVYGQEGLKKVISNAVWQHYSRLIGKNEEVQDSLVPSNKPNLYLIGGSGTGKTLTCKLVGKLMGVPFVYADATEFSEVGYKGEDVSSIAKKALDAAEGNLEKARLSFVFVDEFDKKAQVLSATDDVNQRGVQSGFLPIIEGKVVYVEKLNEEEVPVDTSNMLFTFAGAHEGLDKIFKGKVGFQKNFEDDKTSLIKALIKFGINPQLLGRFQYFVATEKISKEGFYHILKLEKNPIMRDLKNDFKRSGIELEIAEIAYDFFAEVAEKDETGARALAKTVNSTLLDTLYELSETNLEYLLIDENFLKDPQKMVAKIKENVKMKEPEELITLPTREEKKQKGKTLVYKGYSKDKLEADETYKICLIEHGLHEVYLQSATSRGRVENLEPLKIFELIALYNQQVDNLEEQFLDEFEKELIITEETRDLLINLGLSNLDDSEITGLIYETTWKIFEDNKEIIEKSRKKKLVLEAKDIEHPKRFLQRIKRKPRKIS